MGAPIPQGVSAGHPLGKGTAPPTGAGEECLPLGDEAYVQRCGETFGQIVAAINVDGVGHVLDANTVTMMAHSRPFEELIRAIKQRYAGIDWIEPWPQSNHSTYTWRGVPSIAMTAREAVRYAHLRSDTVEWISPTRLGEVVRFITEIIMHLQNKTPRWTREA